MKIVDFKSRSNDPRFLARLGWKLIFDYYREYSTDFSNMDNLLCDYDYIAKKIDDNYYDVLEFYWCSINTSTWIGLNMLDLCAGEDYAVLQYNFKDKTIKLHKVKNESLTI